MDLPFRNMYNDFKDEIWKELGPLDPDWFDVLTAQTFTNEGSVSDQDDLCANQEGNLKTTFDTSAVDSQLFSTPKVFRRSAAMSPETEDEQSFTTEQDKETLPWMTTEMPCLFQVSKGEAGADYEGVRPQDSFDLLHAVPKSPVSYAKEISESLGAQVHADISWTSSLNTPPALPSTLILSKTDESPCPVNVTAEKDVVVVQKLFPSLSNPSRVGTVSPKQNDIPTTHRGGVSPEAGQSAESHDSPQSSLNQSASVWRQKLPDVIEDREIRSTVASVLDGAENVLSLFFANSRSALRKVKTDRIKRKLITPIKDRSCSSTDISTTNNAASSEQRTDDLEPVKLSSSSLVKTDTEITQWSPLSLSEFPSCTVDSSCHDNSRENNNLSVQLVKPPVKSTDSGFTKKKRTFIYTVGPSKTEVKRKETLSQKMDSSPGISNSGIKVSVETLGKAPENEDSCSIRQNEIQKQEYVTEENLPPSVQAKIHDIDMSQLCRDFAQDFSQMFDPGKLSKVADDTPRNGFSPSACLSAIKRAKKETRQADTLRDCDVYNSRLVSATNQNNINDGTVSDSGFQSAVADITPLITASFIPPSTEDTGWSEQMMDFKTDIHRTVSALSTNTGNGRYRLDDVLQEAETDTKLLSTIKESQALGHDRESESHIESTSTRQSICAKRPVNNSNCFPLSGEGNGSFSEKTSVSLPSTHAAGFKTASNKGIQISSASLKRVKHFFEENEAERTFSGQATKRTHEMNDKIGTSNGSLKNIISNSNQPLSANENFGDISCQLTASQKADVTELCTLLEEADSQFEFTQFKTAKPQHQCQDNTVTTVQKTDKEVDPDFLMGIDFDDSFSSQGEKHLAAVTGDKMTSVSDGETNFETSSKSTSISLSSAMEKENVTIEDAFSSSKHIAVGSSGIMSAEPKSLDRAGYSESSKVGNKNPLMLGVEFKSAGGDALRVSKQCLSKARALFSDLEENMTDQKSPDKQSSEVVAKSEQRQVIGIGDDVVSRSFKISKLDTNVCRSGFQMASGKGISISAKAMQEADAFFKDCDSNTGMSVKHKNAVELLPESVSHMQNSKFKVQEIKENVFEEPEFERGCTEVLQHSVESQSFGFKNTPAITNIVPSCENRSLTAAELSSPLCTASKNSCSSASNELSSGGGFCTASGRKVSVSAEAVKKAQHLLNEIHTLEDTSKQLKQRDAIRTDHLTDQIQVAPPKTGGFQTASGKGVLISPAALRKAKSFLNECEAVEDKIFVKPTPPKMPGPDLSSREGGVLAASGKPLILSTEALHKAKALFSGITLSAEIPFVSDTRKSDKKHNNAENTHGIHCGFTTAGGVKVCVSEKNLLKAKNLFKEFDDGSISAKAMQDAGAFFKGCDDMDSNNEMSVCCNKSAAPVSKKKPLSKLKQDPQDTNTFEEPGSGHTESEILEMGSVVNHDNLPHHEDVEIHKGFLENTPDSTKRNTLLMPKPLSSPSCATSENGSSMFNEFGNSGGFCTASGKKVSVSDDAMTKAKSLLNESATFTDTNKGFAVPFTASKKAKTFNKCDGVLDKICVKSTHTRMPLPHSPHENGGFLAASGKPVAFSSEALKKAKALFSDIGFSAETSAVSDTWKTDKKQNNVGNTEKKHCGFTTAGGAKVCVSEKNLLKAKNLLKEFKDGEIHDANSTPHYKSDLSKVKDVERISGSYVTKAREKDMSAEESVLRADKSLQSDRDNETLKSSSVHGCISSKENALSDASKVIKGKVTSSWVGNHHDTPGEEMANVLRCEVNHTGCSDRSELKSTEESSLLIFQSLDLSSCTETQQKFLAQEALDCTKALLEDESLSMTLQDELKSNSRSVEEQKGRGKRSVDDADMAGQPPLKRRLLEDFDRTVDGTRSTTLHPQKSCPNSAMNDRRGFKYSISLHPNIIVPHRNGKNYVETTLPKTIPAQHAASGDSTSAHSKMPVFVPPFLKNVKIDTHKNTPLKDDIKTPSAFVPPFKKQRTIVQENSYKPQEDKHHHLFIRPHSRAYVPPAKKTQHNTDAVVIKSKEDIQTVALAETNDYLRSDQNVPAVCGSEDSAVEPSCVDDTMSRSQDMRQNLENMELARDMQDMRIRKKKRQAIRPVPGSLFQTKTSDVPRIPLKAAVNGEPPGTHTQKQLYGYGVHQHVSEVTSETAESFRFNLQQFLRLEAFLDAGGVQLADGGWLIPSNSGTVGKEEFYRAICDTPGVDPKLLTEEWVYNHYRWIVWKQASMERSFPETMGGLCLTPEQVLLQLKYRYDVEVDHSRRSALRKIMEKDDTAAKTLVLCVCGIVSRGQPPNGQSHNNTKTPQGADAKVEPPSAVVWLTDGWYAIKAQLDEPLTAMLHKGRVAVGRKLIIHGAQLVGSQDACSPLEAPESLMLKICANSSRPARWDTKLGFHRDPRPFLLPVSSLYSNGGAVGCVDITILRSYPIQWMERKPDRGVVFRSVRAEEKEERRYSSHKQKAMEILVAKIQAEFENEEKGNNKPQRRRQTKSRQDVASLQDGEELYEAVGDDPGYLEAHLSEQQLETLQTYRCSLMDKKQAELQDRYRRALEAENNDGVCPKRDVTPVWRLCVTDSIEQPGSVYQLNLWRPSSDLQSLLKEGCRYKVYNLTTSDGKKRSGIDTIQLTGTKKTQFQNMQVSWDWLSTHFQPRVCTTFVNLQNPEFQSLCGEVDLTGYVISVIDGQGQSPAFYLADERLNFVKVRCFCSFSQSGLEDVVKPFVLFALSNLQLRGQSTSPTPVVYAGDLTVFSTNPKEGHLQESFSQLRNMVQGQENFFLTAEEKLSQLIKSNALSSVTSPACTTKNRQDTKTSLIPQQPIRGLGSFTPVNRNPPTATTSVEKDPKSLKRRRALDYLSRIPSPPALSHLTSLASPCVNKTFNPPRRSATPSTLKLEQTPGRKPVFSPKEDEWVNDEELAMIDTQTLCVGDLL